MSASRGILQLKLRLLGISPMIWHRVLVYSSTPMRELHGIFQVAMGWDGIHLFQFDIRAVDYGSWELHAASPNMPLHDFGFRRNARFSYIYDMGDHLMLQTRTHTLDGTLRTKFQQWYPGMKSDQTKKSKWQRDCPTLWGTLQDGQPIPDNLIRHIAPLGWEHINLSGDYIRMVNLSETLSITWDMSGLCNIASVRF